MKLQVLKKFYETTIKNDKERFKQLKGFHEEALEEKRRAELSSVEVAEKERVIFELQDTYRKETESRKKEIKQLEERQQHMMKDLEKDFGERHQRELNRQQDFMKTMFNEERERSKDQIAIMEKQQQSMMGIFQLTLQQSQKTMDTLVGILNKPAPPPKCLYSEMLVKKQDGKEVPLKSLEIGDCVESVDRNGNTVYSAVYYNVLYHEPTPVVKLVCLDSHQKERCVSVTDDHLVYISDKIEMSYWTAIASSAKVGDFLWLRNNSQGTLVKSKIIRIEREVVPVVQNLLVLNNCLVVNGILASCYAINQTWEIIDSLPLRILYFISPSLLKSPTLQKIVEGYDNVVETFASKINKKIFVWRNQYQ